ncbi:MAG: virulence factor SrfC family protein, partial [Pseudomonadota bacterium]
MTQGTDIATRCTTVADAARAAEDWLAHPDNADLVGGEAKLIRHELRRGAMRARKLGRAAQRRMAISVFGPSQAGKSFLVSVLARPASGQLTSNFPDPGGKLDFISEINPEGEGESTGIVTRFTTAAYQAPGGFPVMLRLLSESDIARILVNTFLLDGDKSEPEPTTDDIEDLYRTLGSRKGNDAPGVTSDDVIETQEYLTRNFGKSAYVAALGEYWDRAIEIAPKLSVADRGALFAPLWGRHAAFTQLYVRLGQALESLGSPEIAFAGLDALVPREDSIIDVKLLGGIDQDGGPTLRLATEQGHQAELPKALVTAIAAEMVLPMLDSPDPLFDGTDLLDFPGARTRFEKPLDRFLQEASGPLKECVLRGKVAYLFDRYVAEQEITSMLLCIPDSNMEVADLPVLIG